MTPEQEKLVEDALTAAGPDGWPQLTNDPEVNYEIDRRTELRFAEEDRDPVYMVPWAEVDEETKDDYRREAALSDGVLKQIYIDL